MWKQRSKSIVSVPLTITETSALATQARVSAGDIPVSGTERVLKPSVPP